jgi:hypothetical protein
MSYVTVKKSKLFSYDIPNKEHKKLFHDIINEGVFWRVATSIASYNTNTWPPSGVKLNAQLILKSDSATIRKIINKFGKRVAVVSPTVSAGKTISIRVTIGAQVVKFQSTGGDVDINGKSISDSTLTRMQELGSAWIFRQAIQQNKKWNTWQNIREDTLTMTQLFKIWKTIGNADDVGDDWLENFHKQNNALLAKIGDAKFTQFNRSKEYILPGQTTKFSSGETFMEWVTAIIKKYTGISKKDTWNPADIWLIKNEGTHRSNIENSLKGNTIANTKSNLLEINAIFRTLFANKEVFGISLKKVGGSVAHIKYQNHDEPFFKKMETLRFTTNDIICALDSKRGDETAFSAVDSHIMIGGDKVLYDLIIGAHDTTKLSGLKYEPKEVGHVSRLGKASVELVIKLLKNNKITFKKSFSDYPKTKAEFIVVEDKYKGYIMSMKKNSLVNFKSNNVKNMIKQIKNVFDADPAAANSKCQQLTFLYHFTQLSETERNLVATDIIFLAMKVGRKNGPFAKIY